MSYSKVAIKEKLERILTHCQNKCREYWSDMTNVSDWLDWFEASETVAKILRRL
jgi:hypothetical protein